MKDLTKKRYLICTLLFAAVLIGDQALKIWVKTHMLIGDYIPLIGQWCQLHFIENEGMAFGILLGGDTGKLILSLVRLAASIFIVILLNKYIKKPETRMTLIISMTLILVGAIGNLIDSCFYGLIFNESYPTLATLFPEGGGYGTFLHGRVVDMFYFPLFEFDWPEWIPLIGGNHFEFFSAIFNVADSAITIGVIMLIIDQLFCTPRDKKERESANSDSNITSNDSDTTSTTNSNAISDTNSDTTSANGTTQEESEIVQNKVAEP